MNEAEQAANPIGTEMIFEDDQVRIWTIDLAPGEEAPFHTHLLDYTTITIEGDMVERINADGSRDRIPAQAGAVTRWYQSTQRHGLKNVGSRRFRNIIVEVKALPADFPHGSGG
jgi:hypothetical protein